ncbi:MAG TPA: DUF424 family protein [Thermoplasmata archaeon]|nr:DUF424 family protein [Thermoplasmata archaeon]
MAAPGRSSGIVMRVHRVRTEVVLAACDEELLDRDLPVGANGRTVKVSPQFYGERRVAREELVWALQRATIVNLLGERVCGVASEEGFLTGATGRLGGVPHAQIIGIPEG